MSWRTIMVTKASKISTSNNYIVVENDILKKIFVEEIDMFLIEHQATTITIAAINLLSENNINVIYCDTKHNPCSFSSPIYGNHIQSKNLFEQINWKQDRKDFLWSKVIEAKIKNQYITLNKYFPDSEKKKLILQSLNNIELGDSTNREGMVAKIYFKEIFGKQFIRHNEDVINGVLNYAYSILASSFSRIIISRGYITNVGIHHKGIFNHFNFTYDLLEPYRPIIDYYITQLVDFDRLDSTMKKRILLIFNNKVKFGEKKYYINNSIELYFNNVLDVLNGKTDLLKFPILEYSEF